MSVNPKLRRVLMLTVSLVIPLTLLTFLLGGAGLAQAEPAPLVLDPSPPLGDQSHSADNHRPDTLLQFTAGSHILGFRAGEVYFAAPDHMLKVEFVGGRAVAPQTRTTPGNDRQATPLDTVTYANVWDGVTLIYQKSEGAIAKSTYLIAPQTTQFPPSANRQLPINQIRLRYNVPVHLDAGGSLVLEFETGQMRESAPIAWQDINGERIPVPVRYVLLEEVGPPDPPTGGESSPIPPFGGLGGPLLPQSKIVNPLVGFAVGDYDPTYPLVIDPALSWHTFMGSPNGDEGFAVTVDGTGNVYVTGFSDATWGSPLIGHAGLDDAFVAKFDSSGTLVWNTFMGSPNEDEVGNAIAVDGTGNVYVAGISGATWGSPLKAHAGLDDAFVAKFDSSGTRVWNTFMGSTIFDAGNAIVVDGSNIYVTGRAGGSWGTPINPHAGGGFNDAFLAKLNSSGTPQWHTFMGSSQSETGHAIAVGGSGNVYVAGSSAATWGTPINAHSGSFDAFVARFSSNGTRQWNTFMGSGPSDWVDGMVVGSSRLYVTGFSNATWGTPLNPFAGGGSDAFLARLNFSGTLLWHTFMGSSTSGDSGNAVAVDGVGNAYVAGSSGGTWGTPLNAYAGGNDAFAAKFNSSGTRLWHTFMGSTDDDSGRGIAVNGAGHVYVAGASAATWGTPLNAHAGGSSDDAFVAKISQVVVIGQTPLPNSHTAPLASPVAITYDETINPTTVNTQTFAVHAMQTGLLSQAYSVNGGTIQLTTPQLFKPGELVQASAVNGPTGILDVDGHEPELPTVWQFRAGVTVGTGAFSNTGQMLGGSSSHAVALGDLDLDGDLDAFVANAGTLQPPGQGNKIFRNDADTFKDTYQGLGTKLSTGVALGDVDGDGDLDAFVVNWAGQSDEIWLNGEGGNPLGTFSFGQGLVDGKSGYDVALGDLDGDGDLDALVANWDNQPDEVWLNDGTGIFSHSSDSGHNLGNQDSLSVALGDVDGDGDLDAFTGSEVQPNRVWLNDSTGHFSPGPSIPNTNSSWAVALGDLDGDGDLDAFIANGSNLGQPDQVWKNDGAGNFNDSGQSLGSDNSRDVRLGDVNGDGDLDAFEVNLEGGRVWHNDGQGNFSSSAYLSNAFSQAIDLGDLDGDGDLDAFLGNGFNQFNEIWLNELAIPTGGEGGMPEKVYLPLIVKPDNAFTTFVIRNANAGDNLTVTIEDPSGTYNPLICVNIPNNSTRTCGKFPSIGTYKVTANAKCNSQLAEIFHDAVGGTVERSVYCDN